MTKTMPKFRQTREILTAMTNKECIRNVGIVAHIDHGKTTLTDSLLAEAGLIPMQVAGKAKVLDYLEEEQRRGITIKTANISLLHRTGSQSFVINLVDTPGHVDFFDKVSRAIRTIDGAIVVVDAVEGVMPQTETVMRQILKERVKPILFINKTDRLIRELKLTELETLERFSKIVKDVNNLIEMEGEEQFRSEWKVDAAKDSVVVGSALEKWGFISTVVKERRTSFHGIITNYIQEGLVKLQKKMPLHEAIIRAAIKNLPDPRQAQKYRLTRLWKGNLSSNLGKGMLNCTDEAPLVICVTDVVTERGEPIAVGRIFSGTVSQGDIVCLLASNYEAEISDVSIFMGSARETVNRLTSGNIVALAGLSNITAGETIVNPDFADQMIPFEKTERTLPVMTVAIEPADPRELPKISEAMRTLMASDQSISASFSKETGEYLLEGVGELQLEIAIKTMKEISGVTNLKVTAPTVNYHESAGKTGKIATATNQMRTVTVVVQAKPVGNSEVKENETRLWSEDGHGNRLLSLCGSERTALWKDTLISAFKSVCMSGPLCGEQLTNSEIIIVDTKASVQSENPEEIVQIFGRAARGSLMTASLILLEPVYRIEMLAPSQFVGACTKTIIQKRGRVLGIEQKGFSNLIKGIVPVAETFGMSRELRSSTSGLVSWQWSFENWQRISDDLVVKLIKPLREKKGLSPDVPNPESFAALE